MPTFLRLAVFCALPALSGCAYFGGVARALEAPLWTEKQVQPPEPLPRFESELPVLADGETEGVIVPPKYAPYVLAQCSRDTVRGPVRFWTPGEQDVRDLEAKLPDYVRTHLPMSRDSMPLPIERYRRQYVGVQQQGERYIYVNLFPSESTSVNEAALAMSGGSRDGWRRHPVVVCDGGPDYFGVTYIVRTGRFLQISYNGRG